MKSENWSDQEQLEEKKRKEKKLFLIQKEIGVSMEQYIKNRMFFIQIEKI